MNSPAEKHQLREALDLVRQGRLADARPLLADLSARAPGNAEAQHLLGNVLGQLGELEEAERVLRNAIKLVPRRGLFYSTLGNVLKHTGQIDAAVSAYKEAVKLDPVLAGAQFNLGLAYHEQGQLKNAAAAFLQALVAQPDYADAHNQLGMVRQNLGDSRAAMTSFERAIRLRPDFAHAHNNLGAVHLFRGEYDQAQRCFENALRYRPSYAAALRNLALAKRSVGELEQSLELVERAEQAVTDGRSLDVERAGLLQALGRLDEAERAYDSGLENAPGDPAAIAGLAELYEWRGNYQAGLELLETALPDGDTRVCLAAARLYRRVGDHARALELLRTVEQQENVRRLPATLRRQFHFTMGDVLDLAGNYDEAFSHYQHANLSRGADFDAAAFTATINHLIAHMPRSALLEWSRASEATPAPIFIVGMPRSGTSLIEQMLGMHANIKPFGERSDIGHIANSLVQQFDGREPYPQCLRFATRSMLTGIARQYLGVGAPHGSGIRWVTDKMPANFLNLGLIDMLFPAARIIHCVRHPMDVALSCYSQDFVDSSLSFSFDLGDIGVYYCQYRKLMAHWQKTLRIPQRDVSYEQLVKDPEKELRSVLDFLQLPWDPACLEFHRATRDLNTASHAQVRRPVYQSSVDRYQNYESHLAPFAQVLEYHWH